jgi:Concanavalin A-like lectin/glucanases superfamily
LATLIATPAFALATYLAFYFLFSGTENPGRNLSSPTGLQFNGLDSYVEVNDFDEPITGHVAIEAIVRHNYLNSPSNIVTWAGQQSFVLFRTKDNEWGAAYFDGVTRPRLEVASHSTLPRTVQMVAAVWDGSKLSLYVNGELIESYPIDYEMIPAPNKLFIGGIPDGIIPRHQGTRFLDGEVAVVRVSRSTQPLRIATAPAELTVNPDTLVMFDFRQPTYLSTMDLTHRWRAHLRGTYPVAQ